MNTPVPRRTVRIRRMRFSYPDLRRHYVNGDLVMSHVVGVLSASFPPGEDFFVRSVRNYRDQITDPELADQVRGFIGQEVTHGREHDNLNQRLHRMGYPTRRVHRVIRGLMAGNDRMLPPRVRLCITAGLEHYTATIAETLLRSEKARALLGDTEVRSILLWHALEESEHKAVAFDVYRAIGGTERMRIWTMRVTSVEMIIFLVVGTLLSMLTDRATYNPVRLVRSIAALRCAPFLSPVVIRHLRAYNKPGFHPDDFDTTDLLERWREELFGPQGELTGNLR